MNIYEYTWTRKRIAELPAGITNPTAAESVLRTMIGDKEQEHLVVLYLNTKNRIIGSETVYIGNTTSSSVRAAEVFRGAIRMNATGIIVGHNHPSGDTTPSPDDLSLTASLVAAGRLLDLPVLDHIIVGEGSYTSLRDRGVPM